MKTYSNIPFATVSGAELSGFLHLANEIDYVMTMRYTNAIDNENQYLPFVAPLKTISSNIAGRSDITYNLTNA